MNAFKTLIAAATFASTAAQATVIDFNGQAGTPYKTLSTSTYTTGGLNFKADNLAFVIGTAYSNSDLGGPPFNGTDYYMSYSNFTITSATATPFSVNSLDFSGWTTTVSQVTLLGVFAGGSVTQTFNLDTFGNGNKVSGNDFTAFKLTGFNNLTSLTVSHNGNTYLALDNLVINAATVPEPSSIALFGLALAGVAVVRRRRA